MPPVARVQNDWYPSPTPHLCISGVYSFYPSSPLYIWYVFILPPSPLYIWCVFILPTPHLCISGMYSFYPPLTFVYLVCIHSTHPSPLYIWCVFILPTPHLCISGVYSFYRAPFGRSPAPSLIVPPRLPRCAETVCRQCP